MNNIDYDEQHVNERAALLAQIEEDKERLLELQSTYQRNVRKLELLNQLISNDQGKEPKKFEEHLVEIIKDSSVPMHINEIYKELIQRKVPIPGKGTLENVVTRLTRAKDTFVREGMGTYTIVEKGGDSIARVRNRFSRKRKGDS